MKYAVYLRVSTNDQTVDSQRQALRERVAGLVGDGHTVEWREETWSGATMGRAVLQRTLLDLREGRLGGLVVYAIDRLGRDMAGMTTVFDEFIEKKWALISLKENVDLSTPAGRLVANIMAAVAQHERECHLARSKAGIAAKRARGEKWPGGAARKGKTYALTYEQVGHARTLYESGTSVAEIARLSGCSRGTVKRALEA